MQEREIEDIPVCVSDLSEKSAKIVAVVSSEIDEEEYPLDALLTTDKTVRGLMEDLKE
jgi:hypothetical protein